MRVTIFGPNLNSAAQRKAQFHVHTADCQDCKFYGPGRKHGGEDNGMTIDADEAVDVVWAIYADHIAETGEDDQDAVADAWLSDFHFAPCVKFPKTNNAPKAQKEDTMSGTTIAPIDNSPLVTAAVEALGTVGVIASKSYARLVVNGKTVGYLTGSRLDVPAGKGQYTRFAVGTKAQINKAITAMKRAAK